MRTLPWCAVLLLCLFAGPGCRKETETTERSIRSHRQRVESSTLSAVRWHFTNMTASYFAIGKHDPAWDESVTNAMALLAQARAKRPVRPDWQETLLSEVRVAQSKGCDDPFVNYLSTRYTVGDPAHADSEGAVALLEVARQLRGTEYPNNVRFWACLNASIALARHRTNSTDVIEFRDSAATQLSQALANPDLPAWEAYTGVLYLMGAASRNREQPEIFWKRLEGPLMDNFGDTAYAHVLRGKIHYDRAWRARGGGWADQVKSEGWKQFEEMLHVAEREFLKAWEIDPGLADTADWMIKISNCLGRPREEMEKWFTRAMKIQPDFHAACESKLWYLQPWWHGSVEEMLGFGRECIRNTNYTGNVPLVILDAYKTLAQQAGSDAERQRLYREPMVWEDVKAAVDEMERRNPEQTWFLNNLAWYAWRCEKWDELNAVLPRIEKPDYGYFGGRERYDRMVELARQHARKP